MPRVPTAATAETGQRKAVAEKPATRVSADIIPQHTCESCDNPFGHPARSDCRQYDYLCHDCGDAYNRGIACALCGKSRYVARRGACGPCVDAVILAEIASQAYCGTCLDSKEKDGG